MVGGTQTQSVPQSQPPAAGAAAATSAEEEALKRNTDCVYFLASPLTCKKGSECEYRHSDIARINPRDCWYWLNGNCLNPKCAFRHPPLDGLLGTQVTTPTGSSLPPLQGAVQSAGQVPLVQAKQAVACIFFQKGLCLKGDRCAFMHVPSSSQNKPPQTPAPLPVPEHPTFKKAFSGLERCSQEQKISQENIKNSFVSSQVKQAAKVETVPTKNGGILNKNKPPPSGLDDELPRYRSAVVQPAPIGNSIGRSNRIHQAHVSDDHNILNGKDTDDFSRELSPGFDVLVDDERGDPDYYHHSEDQYGRRRTHDSRDLNAENEYDHGRPANYGSMADVDQDMYRDPRGYDVYDHTQGPYDWDQRRASSERVLGGSANMEKRRYPRDEGPDQINELDLRHRLSKQRRVNGLRSVISHDHARDDRVVDHSYKSHRREAHHLPPHEVSVSSRLRGRIKLPGRSASPVNGADLLPEMDMNRGRNRGRLSPTRPQIHQSRLRDRIKGRVQEDFNDEGRNPRGARMRRDTMNDSGSSFHGPKRLAELKVGKTADSNEQQLNSQQSISLAKRKYPKMEGNLESGADLSFEGPKPLSVILKRKREAETAAFGGGMISLIKDVNNQQESSVEAAEATLNKGEEVAEHANTGIAGTEEGEDAHILTQHNGSEGETEEGMIVEEDAMEDHEAEAFDQRDGDSEYEQVDGEDYDGENAEHEEEYLDDDDGDDFAKKIGVMFS